MATYTLSPAFIQAPLDNSGHIVPGGFIWTYEAGLSTLADTYQTSSGTLHTNPIELDAYGRVPGGLYLAPGLSYKFVFQDENGVTLKTQDNIQATPLSASNQEVLGTVGETFIEGDCGYLSDGSGGLIAGEWYKADADNVYSSLTPEIGFAVAGITSGDRGVFRLAGQITLAGPLTPGAIYYVSTTAGLLTATPPSTARIVGQAESATSLIIGTNPAPYIQGDRAQLILGSQVFS